MLFISITHCSTVNENSKLSQKHGLAQVSCKYRVFFISCLENIQMLPQKL